MLASVRIGAVGQQNSDGAVLTPRSRGVDRRVLHRVAGSRMHVRAIRQQNFGAPLVAEEGCEMQRSPSVMAVGARTRAIFGQQLHNALLDARHGGGTDIERKSVV